MSGVTSLATVRSRVTALCLLVHSVVVFHFAPRRSAAFLGMCLALLADNRSAPPKEKKRLMARATRGVQVRRDLQP